MEIQIINNNFKNNNRKANITNDANKSYFGDNSWKKQRKITIKKKIINQTNFNFHNVLHGNNKKNNNF